MVLTERQGAHMSPCNHFEPSVVLLRVWDSQEGGPVESLGPGCALEGQHFLSLLPGGSEQFAPLQAPRALI